MKHNTRMRHGVQRDFLHIREAIGEMLCLYDATSPTLRNYRAIIEVTPVNLSLKAENEQVAILERFHALLTSLSFPLQVLIRNQRLDLHDYIQRLVQEADDGAWRSPTWETLAQSLAELLQKIAAERTLIERHAYVIIPASPRLSNATLTKRGLRSFGLGRRARSQRVAEMQEQARQELTLRTEMLSQQLAACGLTCHRLNNAELAMLCYSCLMPDRATRHPLRDEQFAGVGHPHTVKRHGQPAQSGRSSVENDERASLAIREDAEAEQENGLLTVDDTLERPTPGLLPLVDLLAPAGIEVQPDMLRVGEEYASCLALTACPREVSFDGWLAPLFLLDEVIDISFHYHPQDTASMKRQLQRSRAGHVSGRRFNQQQGRADDPDALVAEEDINRLLADLARNKERLFDLGFYILAHATNHAALLERIERLYSVLSMLGLDVGAHSTTFEQAEAFQACLPQARDALMQTQTLDATTLATMFPFLSNALAMPGGVLLGITETHEPVLLNPWDNSLENPHMFIGGVTGSGKSYLGKLLVERDLLLHVRRGDQCFIIDPDLEYQELAEALGGTVVRLAPGSTQRLNPFDLLPPGCDLDLYLREAHKGDRLAEKIQDLHAMLDIMLAEYVAASPSGGGVLTKREKGLLDRALYETYRKVGITGDPRTHDRQPPLLRDLHAILQSGVCGQDETDLAGRLSRYVSGSLSSLFSHTTSVDLASHLVVWDIRDMHSELRPLAISLIADRIWTQALYDSAIPRSLYIDEAASLIEHAEGGHFLATLSRRARKRYLRIVTMTQNPEQFVQDPWGSVVAANAAIKVLKTQDATSAAAVAERFHLTKGEQQRLITFGKSEALVLVGEKRVIITIQASQREHTLITTNPVERAERHPVSRPAVETAIDDKHVPATGSNASAITTQLLEQTAHVLDPETPNARIGSNGHHGAVASKDNKA